MDYKIKTDVERREALKEYFELKAVVDKLDRKVNTLKKPFALRMAEIKEALSLSMRPGGTESVKEGGVGSVSLVQKTNYKTINRMALDEWIIEPILKGLSQKKHREIIRRLGFLSSTLTAEMCREHRLATGAKQLPQTTRIAGGDLPPGIEASPSNYITFNEATTDLDAEP